MYWYQHELHVRFLGYLVQPFLTVRPPRERCIRFLVRFLILPTDSTKEIIIDNWLIALPVIVDLSSDGCIHKWGKCELLLSFSDRKNALLTKSYKSSNFFKVVILWFCDRLINVCTIIASSGTAIFRASNHFLYCLIQKDSNHLNNIERTKNLHNPLSALNNNLASDSAIVSWEDTKIKLFEETPLFLFKRFHLRLTFTFQNQSVFFGISNVKRRGILFGIYVSAIKHSTSGRIRNRIIEIISRGISSSRFLILLLISMYCVLLCLTRFH